jgi:hypothetical protein
VTYTSRDTVIKSPDDFEVELIRKFIIDARRGGIIHNDPELEAVRGLMRFQSEYSDKIMSKLVNLGHPALE